MNSTVTALVELMNAAIPGGLALYNDLRALFTKQPSTTTPAQFLDLAQAASTANATTLQGLEEDIAADQAAHSVTPKVAE